MQTYIPVIEKLALGIICLVAQINILGKTNIAPNSALDSVQNFVLGGIIGGVIYNEAVTVTQFILVLVVWTFLVLVTKFLKEHTQLGKRIIDGIPVTLVRNGQVDVAACMRTGLSADNLMFKLREDGITELSRVKRAVLEQNGQLTVIENGDATMHYPIIADGKPNPDVLEIINHDEGWLLKQVQAHGYNGFGEIYLGEYIDGQVLLTGYVK
ncbi:DUF421 domain-containing protein [Lacticaseibacillus pabuli]|uniref:DUF421 domain-containing protein n=1 Tax=Lacticaseibacillus pabuli TaxID=3025672 RepID=A0ABY7WRX1_9LACO|nr:DUF421 domain-containing protein [Lacticaseibacillus sp. KACC 23028]WDF82934.1 DUF421 domain-containing protein [Lacticaseibacillus sp. KACC 23028]